MSIEKNKSESQRWLNTAKDDLEAAQILKDNKKYSLACFHCQQAAEKAIKSAYYLLDLDPWGHSVYKLIHQLGKKHPIFSNIRIESKAKRLDQLYIPTRYPNGIPDITPVEAFSDLDAQEGISHATEIITIVKTFVTKH